MDSFEVVSRAHALEFLRSGEARRVRTNAGLSLADVADALHTTAGAVSRWETGVRVPSGRSALAYKRLLDQIAEVSAP